MTKRREHVLLIVLRTIAAASGAALLTLAAVACPSMAVDLGIAKALAAGFGLATFGLPLIWAGVTGRGALLEDVRDRLDVMREHVEAYHAGRLTGRAGREEDRD